MSDVLSSSPGDSELIIELVRRVGREECAADHPLSEGLEECVRESVHALAASQIKTFVPLLALRRVRACLRAGHCGPEVD